MKAEFFEKNQFLTLHRDQYIYNYRPRGTMLQGAYLSPRMRRDVVSEGLSKMSKILDLSLTGGGNTGRPQNRKEYFEKCDLAIIFGFPASFGTAFSRHALPRIGSLPARSFLNKI